MNDAKGLNAVVYTQLTDVETEANGLLTYDRAIIKPILDRVVAVNRGDYSKVPVSKTVVATSRESGQNWHYTTETPATDWFAPGFDDLAWKEGQGVFGTDGTPGAVVRTKWDTPDIWIRRSFTLGSVDVRSLLIVSLHDEDAEYYLNGVLAAKVKDYVGRYEEIPISERRASTCSWRIFRRC